MRLWGNVRREKTENTFVEDFAKRFALRAEEKFITLAGLYGRACQSPIERVFYAAVLCQKDISPFRINLSTKPYVEDETMIAPGIYIFPQSRIAQYTSDFLAICVDNKCAVVGRVVAECDGHNFHEKTREQAAHDKKRDRFFTVAKIQVLRFTGAEIWRNPIDCADEFIGLAEDALGGRPWDEQ